MTPEEGTDTLTRTRIRVVLADDHEMVLHGVEAMLAHFPALAGGVHCCRARSGLIRVQLWPRSRDFHTTFDV